MEDSAIRSAFEKLIDGDEFDNLHAAASCRALADWLVGYNATRLFSILYGTTLNTGRVQSPTREQYTKLRTKAILYHRARRRVIYRCKRTL
jgi:DNA topoisomerase IA